MSFSEDLVGIFSRFGFEDVDENSGPCVPADRLLDLARALKEELNYRFFVYCAAAHYLPVPANEEGEGAKPGSFLVAYRLRKLGPGTVSVPFCTRINMDETCPSLSPLFAGADWQEREQYDLVGVQFEGHPDLRRIMMPEDWPGHPLQRDYAIDTSHHPWR
jgi:NADH-quinone oxidoreductase subunit C